MLRLTTYNVLATDYIRRSYYPRCSPEALDPNLRIPTLVRRLHELESDILCLQEAQLTSLTGYDGHLFEKKGRPEGSATFWRGLELVEKHQLQYSDGSGHVALIVLFDWAGSQLAVANTHLKWSAPGKESWAHNQLRELLAILPDRAVICGDFNVTPDNQVLRLLDAAGFHEAFPDREPTCVANGRARKLDYVFHSSSLKARPLPVLPISDETALPSTVEPSDHLPLTVELSL